MKKLILTLLLLLLCGAGYIPPNVSEVHEDPVILQFLEEEFLKLIPFTENPTLKPHLFLVTFIYNTRTGARTDGDGYFAFNYSMTKRFYNNKALIWRLRMIIAHELGHEMWGHVKFLSKSESEQGELNADASGIEYFKRAGYPCSIWVTIYREKVQAGYTQFKDHLEQAIRLCP